MAEKMEKDAAELPGISREAEEHQLAYVIGVAQEHLVQAVKPSGRQMKILPI